MRVMLPVAAIALNLAFSLGPGAWEACAETPEGLPKSLTISAGDTASPPAPVCVLLRLAKGTPMAVTVTLADGRRLPAQITSRSMMATNQAGNLPAADDDATHELWFIPPELSPGESVTVRLDATSDAAAETFAWNDRSGKEMELAFGKRPVLRYMYEGVDHSSPERRQETYKPYHHLFDPQGERLVTKGPGGLFPHHRGLFYGFNRISYGDKSADTWHCNNGESQTHEETLSAEAGPVLGRQRSRIQWRGKDGQPFATEEREVTAFSLPGGTMIDFASRLTTELPLVMLNGDPQHAGFQFRASQEVPDSTQDQTYYVRPDGVGERGKFRNWPDDPAHVDLPWHALSFVIGGKRYTCCRLDRPDNPHPARYSERDYGRFGSYFEYQLTPDRPLVVHYRLWLQEGEMSVEECAAQSRQFVAPQAVTAGK